MLVYFSYPYTSNKMGNTMEILKKVAELCEQRTDITPIIPHIFDLMKGLPEGYENLSLLIDEIKLISICDCLVYWKDKLSAGVMWEIAIARYLGKPTITFEHLKEWRKI